MAAFRQREPIGFVAPCVEIEPIGGVELQAADGSENQQAGTQDTNRSGVCS